MNLVWNRFFFKNRFVVLAASFVSVVSFGSREGTLFFHGKSENLSSDVAQNAI